MDYSWDGMPLPAAGAHSEEERGPDIREYLYILARFKWGILSMALLAGLIGLFMAFKAVPIYRSQATLQIERQGGPNLGDLLLPTVQSEFYVTQYELLRSWSVAEIAAGRLGLLDPEQLESQAAPPAATAFSWRKLVPEFLAELEPEPARMPEVRREQVITGIQKMLRVVPVDKSELVHVAAEHARAEFAAEVANTVAESYIDFLRDKNLSEITGSQSWYASRIEQARADLEQAEQALQDFLDRQGLIQTSGGVDELKNQALQVALNNREQARQQKLALERLYRQVQQARASGSLESIAALESRGIVRQLKTDRGEARRTVEQLAQRYGPRHPRMIEAQALSASAEQAYLEELEMVANAVVADYQRAVQTEASYTGQLDSAQADMQVLNRSRAELGKLQDDVRTSRALFEQLQSGEKTAGLLEGGQQNINATVIEEARPGLYPVYPDKQRMVLLWALGGLFVGLGLAFLLERLDNTFKGSEDVERRLGLPVMGQLPQLKTGRNETISPMSQFVNQPRSAFAEAIRTIRTGLLMSTLDEQHSVIAVTSSVPGEGKTTLVINLAHALAQMKKTLLIDADMRRPMVSRAKQSKEPRPGLAALMTGEASLAEVIEVQADGLHVMPSGTVPPNPLELISSQKFRDLLASLRADYEVIVIDSAPALAVSDALVISQMADVLVYVVSADDTPYQAAEQGVKRLRRVNAPLLGCVLNRVAAARHGYGYGKRGKYGSYFRYGRPGGYDYESAGAYHEYIEPENGKSAKAG